MLRREPLDLVLDVETTHLAGAGRQSFSGKGFVRRAWSPVALLAVSCSSRSSAAPPWPTPSASAEVADHVARTVRHGNEVVVVSAMGKETDELIRLAGDVSEVRPGREMDMLITAGERKAMALCMALHLIGVPADSFTGSQAGFITDTNHSNAKIVAAADRLRKAVDAGRVPVVGGAQDVSTDHDVTFLGRGGSDTTAVALCHGARRRRLRAVHRRARGVHRRPLAGARPPGGWPPSPSTRCWR